MSEKLPSKYQENETDPYGNTLIRSEWPLQVWRTAAGNYVVWLWTKESDFDGLHCFRKDHYAADDVCDAARALLRIVPA